LVFLASIETKAVFGRSINMTNSMFSPDECRTKANELTVMAQATPGCRTQLLSMAEGWRRTAKVAEWQNGHVAGERIAN